MNRQERTRSKFCVRYGFTVIEIMTAIVVLSILATVTISGFSRQQVNARDTARQARATALADALEKYYDKNGEYPSPRALTNNHPDNTGSAVSSLLSLPDNGILIMPKSSTDKTNTIVPSLGDEDALAYSATSTVGNSNCQTNKMGGCDKFSLSYKKEADSSIVTINSRKHATDTSAQEPLKAPDKPTITAAISGTSLIATSSIPTCTVSESFSPHYSFRVKDGPSEWSDWGTWQSGSTHTQSDPINGNTYQFQVKVRCQSSSNVGDESIESDPISITYLLAPSGLTMKASVSETNTVGTAGGGVCPTGATLERQIRYHSSPAASAGAWSSWTDGSSKTVPALQGHRYVFVQQARCATPAYSTPWSSSAEDSVVMPIAAPNAPQVQPTNYTNKTWTWTAATCPSGNSAWWRYQFTSAAGDVGWVETTGTSATNIAAVSQGMS